MEALARAVRESATLLARSRRNMGSPSGSQDLGDLGARTPSGAAARTCDHERLQTQVIELEAAYASACSAREQLVRLHRVTSLLGEVKTRAQLGELLDSTVKQVLDADGFVLIEKLPGGDLLPVMAHGDGARVLGGAARLAACMSVWSQEPERLGTVARDEIGAFAATPLVLGGQTIGVFALAYKTRRDFIASYRSLVEDVARQIALAFDRSRLYERLEHERSRAEDASRAKDEFLAMLGHELRNPLAPILTATQLMRLRSEGTFAKERTVIERQCKHMIRLVDDLLDITRVTRGKVDLRKRAVEIAEIVAQAVESVGPAMEERSHLLTLDVPETGIVVHADLQRMAQVLTNLLTNAARYTPHGGRIWLSVRAAENTVAIAVKDTGIGIAPAMLPRVFEMFVQAQQGVERKSGGLGLGLAIAKTLIELHGGAISVTSEGEGHGTEFTVTLPRYSQARTSRQNQSGPFVLPTGKPRQVLIVDDNEDAAFLFSEALRRLGHTVVVAHDGPSALAVARQQPPEIAFLDLGLPVMDGYELGRRLRELGLTPPRLVALTGYGNTSDRSRTLEAGFGLHLVKPIDLAQVQDALAKLA